jgi:hypothetical protein
VDVASNNDLLNCIELINIEELKLSAEQFMGIITIGNYGAHDLHF